MSFKEHFCFASHDLTDQFPTQVITEMKTMGVAPINLEGIESGPIFTQPASRRFFPFKTVGSVWPLLKIHRADRRAERG